MRASWIFCTMVFASCGGNGGGPMCGATTCDADETCCTACDGSRYCAVACDGMACLDAATDMDGGSADSGAGTDSGAGDDSGTGTDSGAGDDSGTGTDSGALWDGGGTRDCPSGECRLSAGGACEAPTGPTGNGCCECTDGSCTNFCRCLAADTQIASARGDVPVSELEVGDLVYSVHDDAVVLVPILRTNRSPVTDHVVVRVRLANGSTLHVSPVHPTAEGGRFGDLRSGGTLDGVGVLGVDLVPYEGAFTFDILPASDTGTYYAGGVLVGSTLLEAR